MPRSLIRPNHKLQTVGPLETSQAVMRRPEILGNLQTVAVFSGVLQMVWLRLEPDSLKGLTQL